MTCVLDACAGNIRLSPCNLGLSDAPNKPHTNISPTKEVQITQTEGTPYVMQGSQMPETNLVLTYCPHKGPQSSGYKAFILLQVIKGSFAGNMSVWGAFWATSWKGI